MPSTNELVILLHGIVAPRVIMSCLAKKLVKEGFEVLNINYPSTNYNLDDLADIIHKKTDLADISQYKKVHFVGFSMGGLVARIYLSKYRPDNLGKVVFIGTPHHGSEIADFLCKLRLMDKIFGPSLAQLTTKEQNLPKADYICGSIAGSKSLCFTLSPFLIKKPNDDLVSIESTQLPELTDHIIFNVTHVMMPFNKDVQEQTIHFLHKGKFFKSNIRN